VFEYLRWLLLLPMLFSIGLLLYFSTPTPSALRLCNLLTNPLTTPTHNRPPRPPSPRQRDPDRRPRLHNLHSQLAPDRRKANPQSGKPHQTDRLRQQRRRIPRPPLRPALHQPTPSRHPSNLPDHRSLRPLLHHPATPRRRAHRAGNGR
jgi:hypothetical protein